MPTNLQPYRSYGEGQVTLEQALFCLECELIFAGTARCPCCADEAVWPLSQWLRSTRPAAPMFPTRGAGF